MIRDIKFRGKRTANNKWVYGSLVQWPSGAATISIRKNGSGSLWRIKVNPDTVGQYTGLKDRNGKEIYEGDLLKSGDIIFEAWWSEDEACYMLDMVNPFKEMSVCMTSSHVAGMEVIGNRWDNPELLEDENNE